MCRHIYDWNIVNCDVKQPIKSNQSNMKSNFWRVFDVFLDFVILPYFNAISMDFYVVKCLIYIYFE